ncbi:hypothetical protein [Chitinophaga sp. Cy-1792]|uniref:hypothetical protein n=1 Tax=Chitinophaga sp. Cy-1792 TaxID=2608339 RepID=UPI001420FA04|nr:hypothetical protein [Chitinophaga sp. Cy-1792]NIG55383.1 hypothetical protein [Chitinophaga sp. Cy-1792]
MNKTYYRLKPEVPGGQAIRTILNKEVHPPTIKHLHFEFDDWLGGDLITSFPSFLITERLLNILYANNIGGFIVNDNVEFSFSELFFDLNPEGKDVPDFKWIEVIGTAEDDIKLDQEKYLNVSARVLEILNGANCLKNCEVIAI